MKILENSNRVRDSFNSYAAVALLLLLTAFGAYLLYAQAFHPERLHLEIDWRPSPEGVYTLSIAVLLFGLMFSSMWILHIANDHEAGSYVDVALKQFVYWAGRHPAPRQSIDLDTIVAIDAVCEHEGENWLEFLDRQGNKQIVKASFLDESVCKWAQVVAAVFPGIAIAQK